MVRRIILLVTILALGTGCARVAESRFNPLNWFGRAESRTTDGGLLPAGYGKGDQRPFVAQVTSLKIERTVSGAIVHAQGITPVLGWWDAELIEAPSPAPGVLLYQFRMVPPIKATVAGTPVQRRVDVGVALSTRDLEGLRQVQVQSASNTLTVRR